MVAIAQRETDGLAAQIQPHETPPAFEGGD